MDKRYAAWAARWRVPLGFALGIAYLVFSRPTPGLLLAGGLVALAGLLLRLYAAGYLDKNRALAKRGPYSYTRNPLYLGSFLLGTGFALAGGSWPLGLALAILFLAIYLPVMRREEEYLRQEFGEAFERYAQSVPLFFPWRLNLPREPGRFSWALYRQNREYRVVIGFALGMVFLAFKVCMR